MIFLDRTRSGRDRYLAWKVRAFTVGAALGVLGMAFETWWLMGPAFAVLTLGVLLRFAPDRSDEEELSDAEPRAPRVSSE